MLWLIDDLAAKNHLEPAPSVHGSKSTMHVTTLAAAPSALYSDPSGRLLAAVPGDQGGLFVVDAERGEVRQFIAGSVSGVSGSRDSKLFVASGSRILQVDLNDGWRVADVSELFGCSGRGNNAVSGTRDGSVWISGCASFRESRQGFQPQPQGLGGEALALAYDLYDNHWALLELEGPIVAVRSASTPERWRAVDSQPQGVYGRFLAIDTRGFVWVSDASSVRRMDPHTPEDGWHTPIGSADWKAGITAMTRSHDDGDVLFGFDNGQLLEVKADSTHVLSSRTLVAPGVTGSIDLIHVDSLGNTWFASGLQIHRLEAPAEAWQHSWAEATPLAGGNHDIFTVELDNQLYVAGGLTAGWGFPAKPRVFAEMFSLDPQTNSWGAVGEMMPMARCHNGLAAFEGEVWVVGGRANPDKPDSTRGLVPLDEVIVFDPGTGKWRQAPALNTARTEPVALVSGGRIYAIGGAGDAAGHDPLSSVESIGPGEDSWRFEVETPRPIRQFAGCVLDEVLYVIGLEGAFAYDPAKGAWEELPAPDELPQASYVTAFEGEVWALGHHRSRKSWRYSPAERKWRPGPDLPTQQSWGGAVVFNGQLHVVGGAHWDTGLDSFVWDDRVFSLRPGWVAGSPTE